MSAWPVWELKYFETIMLVSSPNAFAPLPSRLKLTTYWLCEFSCGGDLGEVRSQHLRHVEDVLGALRVTADDLLGGVVPRCRIAAVDLLSASSCSRS